MANVTQSRPAGGHGWFQEAAIETPVSRVLAIHDLLTACRNRRSQLEELFSVGHDVTVPASGRHFFLGTGVHGPCQDASKSSGFQALDFKRNYGVARRGAAICLQNDDLGILSLLGFLGL